MPTVPAPNRLSALQRNVHVAVAALVVNSARGCVDLADGRWVRGLLGVVGGGHFGGGVACVRFGCERGVEGECGIVWWVKLREGVRVGSRNV